MTKSWLSTALFFAAAGLMAYGLGLYVYPVYPVVVWTLLFVCWACYRLRLRAVAQFGSLPPRPPAHSYFADDDDDTG